MKRDNNLLEVIYRGNIYYFTSNAYITRLTGLQASQIERAKLEQEYADKYQIKIELIDGSDIPYGKINVLF